MRLPSREAAQVRVASALAEAITRPLRARARRAAASATEPETRRYTTQDLARVFPAHALETIALAQTLHIGAPRGALPAQPTSDLRELADQLEPLPVARCARRMFRLMKRAGVACGAMLILIACVWLLARSGLLPTSPAPRAPAAHAAQAITASRPIAAAPSATAAAPALRQATAAPSVTPNAGESLDATVADAIDALASARYAGALLRYERLARARPREPAYATVGAILRRKLSAYCAEHHAPGGDTCMPAP
jgi:hypothetical protein